MKPLPTIAIAQMKSIPMDIKTNLSTMKSMILEAKENNVDIIVFPELCLSGYLLGDRFEYVDFVTELQKANEIVRDMSNDIVIIWGNIVLHEGKIGEDGRLRKYNAACIAQNGAFISNGVLQGYMPKNNLPKYRIFDDARHFYPAYKLAEEMGIDISDFFQPFIVTVSDKTYKLALTVCEDLWEDEYVHKISQLYKSENVDLLIDISASPWTLSKWKARERMLSKRVADSGAPILYVNGVGLQNNGKNLIWFDGASLLVHRDGGVAYRAPVHQEGLYNISVLQNYKDQKRKVLSETEELYMALTCAMKDFYKPFNKIVIGLSGGIDSALTLALLCHVFPTDKIITVNMPTRFNSKTTQRLARICAENFGVSYQVIPIDNLVTAQVEIIENTLGEKILPLTKENIQSRLRAQQLASIAAHHKGVFTNNGNKTEVALNYFTLYGDGGGSAAFLGDLWKGQVYALAEYINVHEGKEMIPQEMIDLVPSAELSEDHNVDEGKGDPIYYPYHDKLLRAFVENRVGITDIIREYANGSLDIYLGCEEGTVARYFKGSEEFIDNLKWAWSAYNTEYKRVQLPPVFLTSKRAFGFDRRDTIAGPFIGEEYEAYLAAINAK